MFNELEKLDIWKLSISLAKEIYQLSNTFPTNEKFGMVSQLQRAVISVSNNIAEGKGRFHKKEFVQFLFLARGSIYECISILSVARELNYISADQLNEVVEKLNIVLMKVNSLIKYLKSS